MSTEREAGMSTAGELGQRSSRYTVDENKVINEG